MKNIQEEINFNSNSYNNSLENLNFFESPISSSRNNISINNNNKIINHNNKEANYISQQIEHPFLKEEILNNLYNETKIIQNEYNRNKSMLIKENEEIKKNKKNLINVYYCLYDFRNKLLEKEKELNDKENNLEEYENILKNNEKILKNNIDNFDNYMSNKANELKMQFEQIQMIQNRRELELKKKK